MSQVPFLRKRFYFHVKKEEKWNRHVLDANSFRNSTGKPRCISCTFSSRPLIPITVPICRLSHNNEWDELLCDVENACHLGKTMKLYRISARSFLDYVVMLGMSSVLAIYYSVPVESTGQLRGD